MITNSAIIYRGPSMIDGSPIMAIVTGFDADPRNSKTGDLLQVFIIRSDISPLEAIRLGLDVAICGNCPARGRVEVDVKTGLLRNVARFCYVTVAHAPRNVFASAERGIYPDYSDNREMVASLFAGRKVRIGAYGDGAAIPVSFWDAVLCDVVAVTGYTHQWRRFPEMASYCMASCETAADRFSAKLLGFRTFRMRLESDAVEAREAVCPMSTEGGYRTPCVDCLACGGHSAKAKADIVIIAHGGPAKHYRDWRAAQAA